jgi:hypothetical protein
MILCKPNYGYWNSGKRINYFFFLTDFFTGILPILESFFKISSQTLLTADSKSSESSGKFCQVVGPLPNSSMERIDGKGFIKL